MNVYADKAIIHSRSGAVYNPPKLKTHNYPPWGIGMLQLIDNMVTLTSTSESLACTILCTVLYISHFE